MADKLTLDFENNMITWDTDFQQGTEYCDGLKERKSTILKAMGYETVDFSPVVKSMNDFANGKITQEELLQLFDDFTKEDTSLEEEGNK